MLIERIVYKQQPIARLEITHDELITLVAALKEFADKHTQAARRDDWYDWAIRLDKISKES